MILWLSVSWSTQFSVSLRSSIWRTLIAASLHFICNRTRASAFQPAEHAGQTLSGARIILDISSTGVHFTTATALPFGARVILTVPWPCSFTT